jgi:hypothetical protein
VTICEYEHMTVASCEHMNDEALESRPHRAGGWDDHRCPELIPSHEKKKASKTLDKKQKEPKKQSRTQRAG